MQAEYPERASRLSSFTAEGSSVTLHNMRAMRWPDPPQGRVVEWRTETFDLDELTNVYFVIGWWNRFKFMAHNMISFEFADGRVVTPSIEIRPKVGQSYNAAKGMTKTYELQYLWSTEADALLSRTYAKVPTRLHLIEAVLSHQAAVRLFEACIERTNELTNGNEYYHSLHNSCSSNIFDIVEQAIPGNFKRSAKRLLPGHTFRFLARNGALRMQGDVDETLKATSISDRLLEIGDVDDFSQQLRNR